MTFRKLSKCNEVIVTNIYAVVYKMECRKEETMILGKISKLVSEKGISISSLEKTLGFGNGTIRGWKESSPSVEKLKKVADYFGVSIEYFLE
jgi:hypothetical protein